MAAWQAPEFRALGKTLGDVADGIAVATQEKLERERAHSSGCSLANATDLILLIGGDGQRLYASPACRTLLGFEPEEMLRISSKEAIHPEDVGVLDNRLRWSDGAPTIATYRMRRKDGGYVWVEGRFTRRSRWRLDSRVNASSSFATSTCASPPSVASRKARCAIAFLAENKADMVFQYRSRSRAPICLARLQGDSRLRAPEDLIGKRAFGTTHPDDAEACRAGFQSVLLPGQSGARSSPIACAIPMETGSGWRRN